MTLPDFLESSINSISTSPKRRITLQALFALGRSIALHQSSPTLNLSPFAHRRRPTPSWPPPFPSPNRRVRVSSYPPNLLSGRSFCAPKKKKTSETGGNLSWPKPRHNNVTSQIEGDPRGREYKNIPPQPQTTLFLR